MLEVIVSSVLLAIMFAGLANIYVAGKRYVLHTRSRMSGGELGRLFLDPLQNDVRAVTWDASGNNLNVGTRHCGGSSTPQASNCPSSAGSVLPGADFNATYVVDSVNSTDLRRVKLDVKWVEQ